MPFYPGLGVGGHCIPDDPLYLYWKARHSGFSSKFIKLSADINRGMVDYAVSCLQEVLKTKKKKLKESKLLVIGVTYKKDVHDLRKSTALSLIEALKSKTGLVDYHDPIIPYLDIGSIKKTSIQLTEKNLKKYNCVIIAVDHTKLNYAFIRRHAKLIYDIRNVYAGKEDKKIVRF